MNHNFKGRFITNEEFSELEPRNVFFRQLTRVNLPCDEHRNRHILFRKSFELQNVPKNAEIFISADDYYKLYINGEFVAQGPAPSFHFAYNYNTVDVKKFLKKGKNVIAVHTLYQGLVNRVWQSGDNRHGLILDLVCDGECVISSDESFLTARHTAYTEVGTCGYDTQFLETYDSRARECSFFESEFDDAAWENAKIQKYDDRALSAQKSSMLVFEKIEPESKRVLGERVILDFGSCYVGYLVARVRGRGGDTVTVRCAQELNPDGSIRYNLRANCKYEEHWILADGESVLDWFDYKSFRYAELELPEGAELSEVYLVARHYPFKLARNIRGDYASDERLVAIWDLCVHSLEYGIQEVIQDCMEREKGFYLGDGCYTTLTHMVLTGDDSMVHKLIDDAFSTERITDTLMTCMDCSFMQEIAEYPLMLTYLVLWHYRLSQDESYLRENYPKVKRLLDAYRREYERTGLLSDVDKFCVVDWPMNYRHGYDVDLTEGQVCREAHVALNAYYIEAIKTANKIAAILGEEKYRDESEVTSAFTRAFYDEERGVFCDGINTRHACVTGNAFPFGFGLCPDERSKNNFIDIIKKDGISTLSFFGAFPALLGFVRYGREDLLREALLDEGAWLRMLKEDGTTTFEGWGKETKINASLFHLVTTYAALFMADVDLKALFE